MARMKLPGSSLSPNKLENKLENDYKTETHYNEVVSPMVISKDDYISMFGTSSEEEDDDTRNLWCNTRVEEDSVNKKEGAEIGTKDNKKEKVRIYF